MKDRVSRVTLSALAISLQQLARAARGRPAGRAVSEAFDDPRDPFPVEIFARDDHDAAPAEEIGGRQNTAMPEGHDRLPSARGDRLEMLEPLGAPAKRRPQERYR